MTSFYGDSKEEKPHNAPKPLGKEIDLKTFVNSNHAGDRTNSHSRTGYKIFMNISMIYWHTEKQSTVNGAVFGADFVAMNQDVVALCSIRYKLRMMGVEIYVCDP